MAIDISRDDRGHVMLQYANWVRDPSQGYGFVMSEDDWADLRWQAVRYELEHGRLRHIASHIQLRDALGDRLI